jgi:UDP-N-acetylglucosamine 2-epimerase (non-hydrolysing)
MNKKKVDLIVGARPNFMKVAPIITALQNHYPNKTPFDYRLIHTGQHYDPQLSSLIFTQLNIPEPDINLNVGSGSQAEQTASIMIKYERLLHMDPADLCLVVGDVTSTMACAITAQKLHIPVAHVEAGIRSGDLRMPEEINRMVTDSITNWFFTTSATANQNLLKSGIDDSRIFFVGNTMIDTLLANMERLRVPTFWAEHGLRAGQYFVVTLHRPSNVDELVGFANMLQSIGKGTRGLPVIFPVHPRTAKTLSGIDAVPESIQLVEPLPYLEFNYLVKNAKAVITDSGGITEETTVMGIPCMTLRDSTERPETVTIGTNELLGTRPDSIIPAMDKLFSGNWNRGSIPPKWDGETGKRIVEHLQKILNF